MQTHEAGPVAEPEGGKGARLPVSFLLACSGRKGCLVATSGRKGASELMASYYTPHDQDCVLQWLIAESRKEPAFVGSILVGSGALGFSDGYSDLDVLVVVDDLAELTQVSERWKHHLLDPLPLLAYSESLRAERILLHNSSRHLSVPYDIEPLQTAMLRLLAEDQAGQLSMRGGGTG